MKVKKILLIVACILAIAFLFIFLDVWCIFKAITGFPCPGCGMTRAWLALFSGNIGKAFFYHPLFLLAPILIILSFKNGGMLFSSKKKNTIFWVMFVALFFGVYIFRMIKMFPNNPPMDYNSNTVLYKIIKLIWR